MRSPIVAGLALLASSTAACSAGMPRLPDAAVILDGKTARTLLHQCSRDTPAIGEATWQPDAREIAELEAALPQAMKADHSTQNPFSYTTGLDFDWSKAPLGWRRQYIGLIRNGRRFIYGNFFPDRKGHMNFRDWRKKPICVCDGGAAYFGVEYDVEARRFTQFAFNDVA